MSTRSATSPLAKGLAVAIVILALAGGAGMIMNFMVKSFKSATVGNAGDAYDLLKRAGRDVSEALQFQPKVIIQDSTVLEKNVRITELATVARNLDTETTYETSWLGSRKTLKFKGQFTAKAGFIIADNFNLLIPAGDRMILKHPSPELLSCELTKIEVVADEDGLWNKLTAADRESATNHLIATARKDAADSDLLSEATANLYLRLEPLQKKHNFKLTDMVIP